MKQFLSALFLLASLQTFSQGTIIQTVQIDTTSPKGVATLGKVKRDSALLDALARAGGGGSAAITETFTPTITFDAHEKFSSTTQSADINLVLASSGNVNNATYKATIAGDGSHAINISDDFLTIGVTDNSQYNLLEFYYSTSSIKPICRITLVPKFTPLSTPTGFAVSASSSLSQTLAWSAVTNATLYTLDKSTDNSTWSNVYTGSALTAVSAALSPATLYYYRLKASAYGYTTSAYASTNGTTDAAASNYAYQFSGDNQSITTANGTDFRFTGSSSWSIGFWVKITSTSGAVRMGYGSTTERLWDVGFGYGGSPGAAEIDAQISGTGGNYYYAHSAHNKAINTWYYVVVTYNGSGAVKVYMNGTDETVDASSGTVSSQMSGGNFGIGKILTLAPQDGLIDDLFILPGTVLTGSQVTTLYNSGTPNVAGQSWYSSVSAYWKFNSTLNDEKTTHNASATAPQYQAN